MIKWSPTDGFNASSVSMDDHGISVGDGIFESMRVTPYGVFALNRHLARLAHAASLIGIDLPPVANLRIGIDEVVAKLRANSIADARLRLTITSGVGPAGVLRGANINWFITAAAIATTSTPAKLQTSRIKRNEHSVVSEIKTLSYLENVIALNEAVGAGFDEALLLNIAGEVAEAATCNLLFELDGELITPPLSSGVLRGITRELLIEKFAVREQVVQREALARIAGAALLSSIRGIQHISHIDNRAIPGSALIAELTEKYQELLKSAAEYNLAI
ncbi:MAG: aminotransferase class IV [Candidatus Nanopelagicales bacterium]